MEKGKTDNEGQLTVSAISFHVTWDEQLSFKSQFLSCKMGLTVIPDRPECVLLAHFFIFQTIALLSFLQEAFPDIP